MKRALILGAGQDASYLAELLLEKQYDVHLLHRRSSADNLWRVRPILDRLTLYQGDLCDPLSVRAAILESLPDEIYNLADQDAIGPSYSSPGYSMLVTAKAVVDILEQLKWNRENSLTRFFQAISATVFGSAPPPQDENTSLAPQSPYAVAKAAALLACRHYRREYGMRVSTAIFFNHDSPRRQGDYLLHKIARYAVYGEPFGGDLNARVDVGWAPEYVDAAWRIVQLNKPDDFCIGTGFGVSVGDLLGHAREVARARKDTETAGDFRRPGPASTLIANVDKARTVLGWRAETKAHAVLAEIVNHYRTKS